MSKLHCKRKKWEFRGLGVRDLGRTRRESEQGARGPINTVGRPYNEMVASEDYPSWEEQPTDL